MTTHLPEHDHADVPELSGLLLMIGVLAVAAALVWLLT